MLAWLASSSGVRTVESGVITEAVEAAEAGTGQCAEPGQGKSLKVMKREENIEKFVNFVFFCPKQQFWIIFQANYLLILASREHQGQGAAVVAWGEGGQRPSLRGSDQIYSV